MTQNCNDGGYGDWMNDSKHAFLNLVEGEIEAYTLYILQDLWELRSMPSYILELIRRNVDPLAIRQVTDFGCGKGAVLIQLAAELDLCGLGFDSLPAFVESARIHAIRRKVDHKVMFEVGSFENTVSRMSGNDLVIYGYEAEVLGEVSDSLVKLRDCINPTGWIISELSYTPDFSNRVDGILSESELVTQMIDNGLVPIDRIVWDIHEVRRANARNNESIRSRLEELTVLHPDKFRLFGHGLKKLFDEPVPENVVCSTWLLGRA